MGKNSRTYLMTRCIMHLLSAIRLTSPFALNLVGETTLGADSS